MKYESLIFDIDGTLWDSRELVAQGYNLQLLAEGHPELCVTAEDLKPLFGKVMTEIADVILATVPEDERYALMDRCMQTENAYLHQNECRIGYEGVRETIAKLSETHRIFIVSNSQCGYPELCIEKLGLSPYISAHLCFGDTGTGKGETIRTLMRTQKIESCVYIGDTQGDCDACREANVPFIFASYGLGNADSRTCAIDAISDLISMENDDLL